MEKNRKRINIIDLLAIILLLAVIVFGVLKFSGVDKIVKSDVATKVSYVVEVKEQNAEVLDYMKIGDMVYEDKSLKKLGVLTDVKQAPFTIQTEDKISRKISEREVPGKINLNIEIEADGVLNAGNISVYSINILIGKTIDLNIGDAYVKGVIVDVVNLSEKEENQQ